MVIAGSQKDEPRQERQRAAASKVESLRRLLSEARDNLARRIAGEEAEARIAAIRASGTQVADLAAVAESKLIDLEVALTTARRIETELFAALFNSQSGLKQPFAIPEVQKDADWTRRRLSTRAMAIAGRLKVLIDARFEVDGEYHAGPLESRFYQPTRS
jgi:hypothetical protein